MGHSERVAARRIVLAASVLLPVVLAGASCQLLVPLAIDPIPSPVDATGDREEEAGGDGSVEVTANPCPRLPPPPTGPIEDAELDPIVFAVALLAMEADGREGLCDGPGFDLDGHNTVLDGGVCENTSCLSTVKPPRCDEDGGIDNGLLALYNLARLQGLRVLDAELYVSRGVLGALIEIRGYNGAADDDEIESVFYVSAGVDALGELPATSEDVEDLPSIWDGSQDYGWTIEERSVVMDGGVPLPAFVAKGYVSGGRLVVLSTGPGTVPTAWLVPFRDGIYSADIARRANRWELTHGSLGVRVESSPLLGAIGASRPARGRKFYCEAPVDYQSTRGLLCSRLDLPASGEAPDAAVPCREMSAAFTFRAVESRIAQDGGSPVVQRNLLWDNLPCPDPDSGTIWCDDCELFAAGRCEAPELFGDASVDDGSSGDASLD